LEEIVVAESGWLRDEVEFVVVDDASTSPIALPSPDYVIHRLTAPAARAGARNAGAALAQGDLLAFVDDDTIPVTGGWRALFGAVRNHPKRWISPWIVPPEWDGARADQLLEMQALATNFLVVDSSTVRELGGFDEELHCLEDYEFSLRARAAGVQLLMYTGATAIHDDPKAASFQVDTIRFHDWIRETPRVWLRTGGPTRELSSWEVTTFGAALYSRVVLVRFLAWGLLPDVIWRAFTASLAHTPRRPKLRRALNAIARARAARAGLRSLPQPQQRILAQQCAAASRRPAPHRQIAVLPRPEIQ